MIMHRTHTKVVEISVRHLLGAAAALTIVTATVSGQRPAFYNDDPITRVVDTQDASKVQPKSVNLVYDEGRNLFGNPGDPNMNRRAMSINTIDEVPDSNWFTNRIISGRPMTVEEVAKGPDTSTGPAPGKWTITSGERRRHAWFHDPRREGRPVVGQVDPPSGEAPPAPKWP